MKKLLAAMLLSLGAGVLCCAPTFAQEAGDDLDLKLASTRMNRELMKPRAQGLRVSAGPDPDTVYLGHSYTDHWSATENWWNLHTGVYRPGIKDPNNAVWDWDHYTGLVNHGIGDSLCGWWPARRLYTATGGLTMSDASRPWWAIDIGNIANYVVNAGPGGKRTKGVVGVWHADAGITQAGGSAVQWVPLSGTKSAWCGLRQHGDNSVIDAVTGNPFNQVALEFHGAAGTSMPTPKTFPGYASQWDQMLYRDLAAAPATPLDISFLYRTRMSTSVITTASTRTGWFHGDPLAVVAGNFISSTDAGAGSPVDSFQVYVGAPVDEANCLYSDGNVRAVYDPQRRWFSEVLRIWDAPYYRIFATAGAQPADTAAATPSSGTLTIPAADVDAIRNAAGNADHVVRLVFRVKTNRGFADDDAAGGFDSATRGAVLIDDVTVNGNNIGDFELAEQGGTNSIDNRAGASPLTHWKSTGKPPSIYFHLENVTDGSVVYNDLCGPWDSPSRYCNIGGLAMVAGNHDDIERNGDSRFTADREVYHGMWSPTINMVVDRSGTNAPNAMGLTESIVDVTEDYYIANDVYTGMFNLQFTGIAFNYGVQIYPCRQGNNGALVWSDPLYQGSWYNPEPQCWGPFLSDGFSGMLLVASTPSGLPDSVRFYVGTNAQCFAFAVSLGCNSSDGGYFDNVSIAFVDGPATTRASGAGAINPTTIRSYYGHWINDTFPANETPTLPNSANFDTTSALLKSGANTAPSTGNMLRFDVPGDTILVTAPNVTGSTDPTFGNRTRVDLVFRILPGPGNYAIASPDGRTFPPTASMQLLRVPTNQANASIAGDGSFWGAYMADPGKFSKGDHHGGAYWDYLTWNSARADSAERNVFPVAGNKITTGLSTSGGYANMLHEADPKFAILGISKFRCFVVDTALAAQQLNIACDGTVPAWLTAVPRSRTGWDGSATTREFTKIIPDGLLTPGAHVQYFWRKSALADSSVFVLGPDTNVVIQLVVETSLDGHRWQQFGVLPDRWKDPAFGGQGMACMLFVDGDDWAGDETVFVSMMDAIGGTAPAKWGAHNGWHAPASVADAYLDQYPVHGKNQQPGSTWDMYGVKGPEALGGTANTLGNRLANRAAMGLLAGKEARTGPTPEMLRKFYGVVAIFSGWINSGNLGPYVNRSQNDIALLNDYLTGNDVGSTPQPRGILTVGNGFVQSEVSASAVDVSHLNFLTTKLGVTLRNPSYQSVSGNTDDCADLITTSVITTNGDVYGVGNNCGWSNDLLRRNPSVPEAVDASYYQDVGPNGPYAASVYKPATTTRNWIALTDGWSIGDEFGRYCQSSGGRLAYYYNMYNNAFGSLCPIATVTPSATLDVPQNGHGGQFANFMKVGNSVMHGKATTVTFGVESAQRVRVRLYDVSGRVVRTLADRSFAAGEQSVTWDGADDGGRQVARGVYFARIEYAAKGQTLGGRVVVLR